MLVRLLNTIFLQETLKIRLHFIRITEDNVPAKLKARVHKYLVDMGYFDDVEE